jgi:site-specific DNA-adenine methylase
MSVTQSVNPPGSSDEFVRPPLSYPGNKAELASTILQYVPDHETYVEPFCGTAGVFFQKRPSRNEVLNDIDSDVTTFLRVLRDQPDALVEYLRHTPYSEAEYERVKHRWDDLGHRPADPVKHAGQLFFLRRASFGSDITGFRSVARGRKNSARQFANARDRLLDLSERLDGVILRNTDWTDIVEDYASPSTFFYLDPPYRSCGAATNTYDDQAPGLPLYFAHHFDGSPNDYYHNRETAGADPPEFLTMDCFREAPTDFAYGTDRDPLTVLISSKGPLTPLQPYTWTVRLEDQTHEINNAGGAKTVCETLTMNYNPTADDFQPFLRTDCQQSLLEYQ